MDTLNRDHIEMLEAQQDLLVQAVVDRMRTTHGVTAGSDDISLIRSLVRHLSQALAADAPALFVDHVLWVRTNLEVSGRPNVVLQSLLADLQVVAEDLMPAEVHAPLATFMDAAFAELSDPIESAENDAEDEAPLADLATAYLTALLGGHKQEASRLVLEAVEDGTDVADVYLHVFQRSQRELGRLWQRNEISIAQEHFCTAATQFIMSQLYPYIFRTEKTGRNFVATCVGGDLHEIGLRMVADLLELDGWDTYYLGADMPAATVVDAVREHDADLLGVSVTMPYHLDAAAALIAALRDVFPPESLRIMVGGYPFNIDQKLWRWVGADGQARDAREAVRTADALVPKAARVARNGHLSE